MREIIDFLCRLHDNNDREWFDAHRAEWKRVQAQFQDIVSQLIEAIGAFDPTVRGLQVKDCVYRINRDTRFSHDKSPYKNYVSAFFAPQGKKSGYAGYYLHIEPAGDQMLAGNLLSAGIYCPEPVVLRSIREEILDHGAEIERTIAASGFALVRENMLKRTPTGFPSGTPHDELLRMKDLYLGKPVDEAFLCDPQLVAHAAEEFRRTQPFLDIINRAVKYAHEEMK